MLFDHPEYDRHELVHFVAERDSGLSAIIAIHDAWPGFAGGGIRMYPYANDGDALADALRLARAMTYKFVLADIRFGGAKAVIIGDPRTQKSEALLRAMGRAIEALGGRYMGGEDLGIGLADVAVMHEETKYLAGLAEGGDTSPPTAHGVYLGLKATVARRLGRADLAGLRVAVQGAGNVGADLCRRLAADGAELVVADLDADAARRAAEATGARIVAADAIYDREVDVFAPCALGGVLNAGSIPRLKAKVVAGCANTQLATAADGAALHARGILYAPDYVINAGGAINAARELAGDYDRDDAYRAIERVPGTLAEIYELADREDIPASAAADRLGAARLAAKRAEEAARREGAAKSRAKQGKE